MNLIPTTFTQFAGKLSEWLPVTLAVCAMFGPLNTLAQVCNPGIGLNLGVLTPTGASVVHNGVPTLVAHIGDTLTVNSVAVFTSAFGSTCGITNGQVCVVYPDNTVQKAMQYFTLLSSAAGGSGHQCPSADSVCSPFISTYVINSADLDKPLTITANNGSLGTTCQAAAEPNEVRFGFIATGTPVGSPGDSVICGTLPVLIINPSISITKQCVTNCPPNNAAVYGSPINIQGTVKNTSDTNTVLSYIAISDSPSALITFSTTTALGNPFDPVVGNENNELVPGDSVDYTGSYSPAGTGAALCGPFQDTLTVTAQDVTSLVVSNSASATCTVCLTPCLQVTRNCSPEITEASSPTSPVTINFSGVVTNCANIPLTNIVITDSVDSGPPTTVTNISELDPGQSATYNGTFTESGYGAHFDVVSATGANPCGGAVQSNDPYCINVVVPAPSFTSIGFNPDQSFGLQFTGDTNVAYQVLVSTNLHDWKILGFATQVTAGAYQFTDTGATNQNQAFYRVVLP
jgi:hypothetical protein